MLSVQAHFEYRHSNGWFARLVVSYLEGRCKPLSIEFIDTCAAAYAALLNANLQNVTIREDEIGNTSVLELSVAGKNIKDEKAHWQQFVEVLINILPASVTLKDLGIDKQSCSEVSYDGEEYL